MLSTQNCSKLDESSSAMCLMLFDFKCVVTLCRHLLVNPKERRVVVVESILSSTTNFRSTMAKVLFEYFEVSFLYLQLLKKVQRLLFDISYIMLLHYCFLYRLSTCIYSTDYQTADLMPHPFLGSHWVDDQWVDEKEISWMIPMGDGHLVTEFCTSQCLHRGSKCLTQVYWEICVKLVCVCVCLCI